MAKLAFLGLGVMGYPMAGHLKANGHSVTVFNRNTVKAEQWGEQHAGQFARSPGKAVSDADFVFSCVGADADLREITLGKSGAFAAMKPGAIYIDNTTTSAEVARELHSKAEAGPGAGPTCGLPESSEDPDTRLDDVRR